MAPMNMGSKFWQMVFGRIEAKVNSEDAASEVDKRLIAKLGNRAPEWGDARDIPPRPFMLPFVMFNPRKCQWCSSVIETVIGELIHHQCATETFDEMHDAALEIDRQRDEIAQLKNKLRRSI